MLTQGQYEELRARINRLYAFVDTKRGKNGWASYKPEEVPADSRATNEEISSVEVYEFVANPPDKYFAYVNAETGQLTTFTGERLGSVVFGREYRDNFGGKRVPITVYAINNGTYYGTYYKSSGDYARIKRAKG